MSANNFFLDKGYTPEWRMVAFSTLGTIALWTPRASARIALTALQITSVNGGTIAFYTSNSSGGARVAEFAVSGSNTISPVIGCIATTALDVPIFVNVSAGASNESWKISAQGFEMPSGM